MTKTIVSAVTIFIYVTGGALLGTIYLLKKYGDKPDPMTIVACILLGLIAMVKDIRSSQRLPPLANGNADAFNQIVKLIEKQNEDKKS